MKQKLHMFAVRQTATSLTGLFTKPTNRHYPKYRFSPDIGQMVLESVISPSCPDHTKLSNREIVGDYVQK